MPPWYYTLLHSRSKLSKSEKEQLIAGLQKTFAASPPIPGGGGSSPRPARPRRPPEPGFARREARCGEAPPTSLIPRPASVSVGFLAIPPGKGRGSSPVQLPLEIGVPESGYSCLALRVVTQRVGGWFEKASSRGVPCRVRQGRSCLRASAPAGRARGRRAAASCLRRAPRSSTRARGTPKYLIVSDLPRQGAQRTQLNQMTEAIKFILGGAGWKAGAYTIAYQDCDDRASLQPGGGTRRNARRTRNAYARDKDVDRRHRHVQLRLRRDHRPDPQPGGRPRWG